MAKENSIKMKREPTVWENIFANDISSKGLISKIYNELTWHHSRNTFTIIKYFPWKEIFISTLHLCSKASIGILTWSREIKVNLNRRGSLLLFHHCNQMWYFGISIYFIHILQINFISAVCAFAWLSLGRLTHECFSPLLWPGSDLSYVSLPHRRQLLGI